MCRASTSQKHSFQDPSVPAALPSSLGEQQKPACNPLSAFWHFFFFLNISQLYLEEQKGHVQLPLTLMGVLKWKGAGEEPQPVTSSTCYTNNWYLRKVYISNEAAFWGIRLKKAAIWQRERRLFGGDYMLLCAQVQVFKMYCVFQGNLQQNHS